MRRLASVVPMELRGGQVFAGGLQHALPDDVGKLAGLTADVIESLQQRPEFFSRDVVYGHLSAITNTPSATGTSKRLAEQDLW